MEMFLNACVWALGERERERESLICNLTVFLFLHEIYHPCRLWKITKPLECQNYTLVSAKNNKNNISYIDNINDYAS